MVGINRKPFGLGRYVGLPLGQEEVRQPSEVEECPLNPARLFKNVAERLPTDRIIRGQQWIVGDISSPLGRNEPFACFGFQTGLEKSVVDVDVLISWAVDQGDERSGACDVQDRNQRVFAVITDPDTGTLIFEPLSFL